MKRRVNIYKYEKSSNDNVYNKILDCEGIFHQFGCDYEEFETGAGNYSTAIVELETGEIRNIPVEMIVFIYPEVE